MLEPLLAGKLLIGVLLNGMLGSQKIKINNYIDMI
jgi:hypothetical protein